MCPRNLVRCNQDTGNSWPCVGSNPDRTVDEGSTIYTDCVGFVSGASWGQCYSECTSSGQNNLWGELSVWGDSVVFELAWDAAFELPDGCVGTVTVSLGGGAYSSSADASAAGRISLALTASMSDDSASLAQASSQQVEVTSTTGSVLARESTLDVFVEVSTSTARCGYNMRWMVKDAFDDPSFHPPRERAACFPMQHWNPS